MCLGWLSDALLPPSGWFWRVTPSKWCTVWPSEYVVLSSQQHSTRGDRASIISKLTHETVLLGGRCAFDRADSHPGKEKTTLGAITFKSSISLSTVKPLHCSLAIEDIIKALFSTATPSVAFRTPLFCLINAQLLISVQVWVNSCSHVDLTRQPFSKPSGSSVCQRTDQVVPPTIEALHSNEPTFTPVFVALNLFLSFPLHQWESWGAPLPDALTLPGLLDKTVYIFLVFFRVLFSARLSLDMITVRIRDTNLQPQHSVTSQILSVRRCHFIDITIGY